MSRTLRTALPIAACGSSATRLAALSLLGAGLTLCAVPALVAAEVDASSGAIVEIVADPPSVELVGPGALWTLQVHGRTAEERVIDLTDESLFRAASGNLAVSVDGVVRGLADGSGVIEIDCQGRTLQVAVHVSGATAQRTFNFENDIVPLLSRFGCNSSGCHGKAEGQNGFKLSVFGFDPAADYDALTKEGRGRRVFPSAPAESLLLKKIAGGSPHGGGVRIPVDSREFAMLRDWIAAGVPRGREDDARVVAIEVSPRERVLAMQGRQRLRVVARYSDGRLDDVTSLARFQSNNEALATVDESGRVVAGQSPGQVAVMASYLGSVDTFRAIVPRAEKVEFPSDLAESNFIDTLVHDQLRKLHVLPSAPADDAEYLRRVYLDLIGTLPTSDEARAFLSDARPDRRARLVDALLDRPEFNDLWALWWADLLRVDRQALGHKGAHAYYKWIRDSLRANKPLDQFARELLTAEGPLADVPQGHFFQAVAEPGKMASTLSQVFLGVRIACAECHHHPFDQWSQTDYFGMSAYFAQVGRKSTPQGPAIVANGNPETRHTRTGEVVVAHALRTQAPNELPAGDRRRLLADWMTAPDNHWFARNLANRVWAQMLGRGLVEPVDDVRATNPPTNPQLLDALAAHLIEHRFDLRYLLRTIAASRTYQRSSRTNPTNERDEQNYSRAVFKRMPAEVLFDAVCQTTGVAEKFGGVPGGSRAVQLWDSRVTHYFLKLFGRPLRESACECERSGEASVAQVLHLMNSPEISNKLAHEGGLIARLVREQSNDDVLIEELYLTFFSRFPSSDERQVASRHLATSPDRRRAAEDLAWSLMNSLEFVFNH